MNWSLVPVLIVWSAIVAFQEFSEDPLQLRTPIQLANVVDDVLVVNDDALRNLMEREELKGRPLMILSIVGEMRTGKSFIMNIFLRYLRNNGWENSNWFYDETLIGEDFKYKRGSRVSTHGMVVHPKIFQIPLEDGRQAAVILVDMQGLYDKNTSRDCNAKLEALSVLFSSHQILNMKNQIRTNELEDLQFCVGIAKQATDYSRDIKPFQALTFLIRDWSNEHEYQFGDSTDGYLDQFMVEKSRSKKLQEVKEYIPKAFTSVGCYLLPHPGEKIAKSDGNLQNSDMSKDFEIQAKLFIENIFHPKNISLKRNVNGDLATASDLLNMIGFVGKKFMDHEFYRTETSYQVMRRSNFNSVMTEAMSAYKTQMDEICHEYAPMTDEQLSSHHEEVFRATRKRFDDKTKSESDKEMLEEFQEQLKKECDDIYSSLANVNLVKKHDLLNEARRMRKKLTITYGTYAAESEISLSSTEGDFGLLLQESKIKALSSFDAKFVNTYKALGERLSNIRKDLISEIEEAFNKRKEVLQREKLIRDQKELESKKQVFALTNEFQSACDKYSDQYHEDLGKILNKIKEEILKKYDKEMEGISERGSVLQNRKRLRLDLDLNLDTMIASSTRRNSKNKDEDEEEARQFGRTLAVELEKELEEKLNLRENYINPASLENAIKKFMDGVEKTLNSLQSWKRSIVKQEIDDEAKKWKRRNEENKKYRSTWRSDILELLKKLLAHLALQVWKRFW